MATVVPLYAINILFSVAFLLFMLGYFYIGKSKGEETCTPPPPWQNSTYTGGVVALTFGILMAIGGVVLRLLRGNYAVV